MYESDVMEDPLNAFVSVSVQKVPARALEKALMQMEMGTGHHFTHDGSAQLISKTPIYVT